MRLLALLGAVVMMAGCVDYVAGPKPKYQSCKHIEYVDSFAVGDSIPLVHLTCPKR